MRPACAALLLALSLSLVAAPVRAVRCAHDPDRARGEGAQPRRALERSDQYRWHVALSAGAGVGLFFASHGRVGLSAGRSLWDRFEVELTLHFDGATDLAGHEEALRLGVLLHFGRRWVLMLGWRVGHARLHKELPTGSLWVDSLVASLVGELRLALTPAWWLRLAPLAATGYWNEIWGFTLEPTAGLAYRF
jgi:hypothetical protein